ncbi:translation initiation factor eIF-2B subunit delta, partial [Phenoliferia sp. Uapishka_3]
MSSPKQSTAPPKPKEAKKEPKAGTKAERRAAARGTAPPAAGGPPALSSAPAPGTAPAARPPRAGPSSAPNAPVIKPTPNAHAPPPTVVADPLQLFLHLDLPSSSSSLSHSSKASTANIHPSIIKLALQYAEFKIVGANARCIALCEALKDIIASYNPPPQTNLTRHLPTTHLNPQINHLVRARPISVSMGTAIRYLKYEISLIEMEMGVEDAKALLIQKIDSFIRDRILLAGKVIEQHAIAKIKDGETILTYARSSLVEGILLEAKRQGKVFSVVVVDSRPLYEGKNLLASLRAAAIPTTYVLLPSLSVILPRVSLCLLGTAALMSNGGMFSRAGTAMVALLLREKGVPVICCCETYKFSERIMLDSIVGNQMAESNSLLAGAGVSITEPIANLSPLSLLYDVARPEDVTVVITEAGLIPAMSVPVLLRDFKPLVQGA